MGRKVSQRGVGSNQHQDKPQTRVVDPNERRKGAGVAESVFSLAANDDHQVAVGPDTQPPVLRRLAKTTDPTIRRMVAQHPNTPSTTLVKLAFDDDENVRIAAATNPHVPVATLRILLQDENPQVRKTAERTLNT